MKTKRWGFIDTYRHLFTIVIVTNCVKTQFSQPGYRAAKNLEQLILNVKNEWGYQNQLYWIQLNNYRLSKQLQILKTRFIDSNEKTVSALINYMRNNIVVHTDFYSEIIVLLKLYLLSPATTAVSKQSASSMYRIKNWLRSTMS